MGLLKVLSEEFFSQPIYFLWVMYSCFYDGSWRVVNELQENRDSDSIAFRMIVNLQNSTSYFNATEKDEVRQLIQIFPFY